MAARSVDEVRIDQQSRLETALHGCGLHVAGLHDVQQAQQGAEGIGAAGEAVEDSVGQRVGFGFQKAHGRLPWGGISTTTRRPGWMAARFGCLSRR